MLNEIGMEPLFDSLQARVLQPLARALFPIEGCALDRHHSFIVQYEMNKDLGLDMHTDNSDVTFNVCQQDESALFGAAPLREAALVTRALLALGGS